MRKVIAAINTTLDGFCDHMAMTADDELHQHYTDLLNSGGVLLYGRITYQLMESYWPTLVETPSGDTATDDFAVAIDNIDKIVFSHTLKDLHWKNVKFAKRDVKEEVLSLKEQAGRDIFIGSPSLIVAAINLNLIDELQLCIQPVIVGKGLPLLKTINERINLKLLRTKSLPGSGSIILYYEPTKK